jgi:hypothetical protein
MEDFVFRSEGWCDKIMWVEFDRITDDYCSRVFGKDTVAAVVVERWSHVKPVLGAIVPRAADGGFVVYLHRASGRPDWRGIEVEFAKEGVPG